MLAAMLNILFWCPVLAAVQTLTIDSQLGTSIEDCFDRTSIGEQLPPDAIYRNITELTTRECEQLCKQDKQCQTYDYGVGAKGNATCNLSTFSDKDLRAQNLLQRNPDYDIYVRRVLCEQMPPTPLQPQFDEVNPPLHRPVFRPDEEEPKNPLSDDFLADLRPFEASPNFRPPRPHHNYIDNDRPDDYNSKPNIDTPPSYGAHRPPEIPYRPSRPLRPYPEPLRPNDPYMPERPPWPLRPDDPYRPQRPDVPYGPENPLNPDDYRPIRPNDPYGSNSHRPDPYKPDRPLRPDPYRPERPGSSYTPERPDDPYRPGFNRPYNHSKPDPYDELQFQGGYGRPPARPDPGLWRPDPIYPPSPSDDVPDLYGPKPTRPDRPYKPAEPDYHYVVRPTKKPRPQNDYNKPAEDPYKPNKPDYEPNRPDPYSPVKPDPIEDTGYGNKPQDYPTKPKPDPYGPGPIGPPDRPYRPNRPYEYPSRPEKPNYSYNSQYASGYGQSQDNSIHLEIYDPPRPYKPMRPLTDKPPSQGYGQNYGYGYGSYTGHHSYAPPPNSHLGYGPIEGLYGQDYNRPAEDERPDQPYGQGSYGTSSYGQKPQDSKPSYGNLGSSQSGPSYGSQSFDYSSGYGQKPQDSKPSYGSLGSSQGGSSYGSQSFDYSSGYDQKPQTSKPSYGSPSASQGGSNYGYRPSYDNDNPSYGSSYDRPSYTSPKPTYGVSHDTSYGSNLDGAYGTSQKPPYGVSQKPSYGAPTPSYGNQDPNRPDVIDKPYESQNGQNTYGQDYRPGQKPNETYRPDVRPVYEYELEKPGNAPSYVIRPNGDVVTSRPVIVGDYGSPGYGKPEYNKPGYGDSPGYRPEYNKPGYGRPDYGSKPGYGDLEYDRPGYVHKPTYGDDNRPYGSKPGYGEKPGYGDTPGYETPEYGKPGYGGGDDIKPSGYGGAGYREKGKLGSYKGKFFYFTFNKFG